MIYDRPEEAYVILEGRDKSRRAPCIPRVSNASTDRREVT